MSVFVRGFGVRLVRRLGLLAGAVALSAGMAAASPVSLFPAGNFTVDYQQTGDAFGSNASAGVKLNTIGWASAGGIALKLRGQPNSDFTAFCLDLAHEMTSGTRYRVADANPTGNVFDTSAGAVGVNASQQASIQKLFNAVYSPAVLKSSTESAAFQLALWEVVTETKTYSGQIVFDVNSQDAQRGNFYALTGWHNTPSAIVAQANLYLADMQAYTGPKRYDMTYLQSVISCTGRRCTPTQAGQNLVTVSAVPVPAAGVLLLTAFGGAGLVLRRRRKAA